MISIQLLILILINVIFFFVLWLKNITTVKPLKYEVISKAETAILGVAFTQYALTFVIETSNVLNKDAQEFAQQLRYIDWLITTPLLLYTYWKLAKVDGYQGADFVWLFFADMVMMIFGILAEFFAPNKTISFVLFIIGSLGYVYIFYEITNIMEYFKTMNMTSKKNLGYFFLLGWLIYPIGFYLSFESKFILYSFGDFINKGLYSIALDNTLDE
jgi:sensory rhodopsin